ncbi:MAG: hypothetical protein ACI87W_003460 [Halieaceae bacterium]|jgi:hypothetical protein
MLQATGLGFEVVYVNDGSADPILADAILDRQMHTAYKINLRVHAETQREVNEHHRFRVALQTPRRYAQTGGSFAPDRPGWQDSEVYAAGQPQRGDADHNIAISIEDRLRLPEYSIESILTGISSSDESSPGTQSVGILVSALVLLFYEPTCLRCSTWSH